MSLADDIAYRVIPRRPWGDRILHRRGFKKTLGRYPSKKGGMNDAIYYIMTGVEATNPDRISVTDKEYVKLYVQARVGGKYNVPTMDLFHNMEDVRQHHKLNRFQPNCVLKPTHLSARVMFTPPHGEIDLAEIEDWFATNYYWWNREPFYKTLKRKVIVEPLLFGTTNITDYKIMCVNGEPRMIWVDTDRRIEHKRTFYTVDWKKLPVAVSFPMGPDIPRPDNLDEMLYVAACLSEDFNLIRIDLYSNGKECYVGEMTNSSEGGRATFFEGEEIVTNLLFGKRGIDCVLSNEWPKSVRLGNQKMHSPTPEKITEFARKNFRRSS